GIHHDNRPRLARNEDFLRMRRARIGQYFTGDFSKVMGSGNCPDRSVARRDLIDHPHHVADPKARLVSYRRHVSVQRLRLRPKGIHGPHIETAQLETVAQNVPDVWRQSRITDDLAEDISFISQVRQASAAWISFE